jgi:Na+/H+-dicarboxylate symporter
MGISGQRARDIVARLIVAILSGIAVGYFFGTSVASDAARGRTLTLKEYIADFENHRRTLLRNDLPMWAALLTMVVLMLAFFGVYELLVVAVDRALRALDRRRGGDVIE